MLRCANPPTAPLSLSASSCCAAAKGNRKYLWLAAHSRPTSPLPRRLLRPYKWQRLIAQFVYLTFLLGVALVLFFFLLFFCFYCCCCCCFFFIFFRFCFSSGHTEQQLQREEQHQFWNCYISVAHLTSLRGPSTWDTHSIHSLSAPPLSPYHSWLLSALLFSSLCSVLKLVINFYAQNMQMLHWWIHSLGTGPSPRGRGIFWGVTSFSTSLPKFDARDASTGNCQPHFVFPSPSLSLFVDFQRTFLKEMKNFMSYFLFNFFRFFLCTPLLSPHLRKWACAWPAAKLIMDERSASCRIVSRRLASRRNVAQLTLFLIPELPTFGRR